MTQQLEASQVAQLTICADGEVAKVAEETSTDVNVAQSARLFWTRKLAGLCVLCGTSRGIYSKKAKKLSMCQGCLQKYRGQLYDSRAVAVLLADLPKRTVVLRSPCISCECEVIQTAGYILARMEKYGEIRPVKYCRKCKRTKEPIKPINVASKVTPKRSIFVVGGTPLYAKTLTEVQAEGKDARRRQRNRDRKRRRREATKKAPNSENMGS